MCVCTHVARADAQHAACRAHGRRLELRTGVLATMGVRTILHYMLCHLFLRDLFSARYYVGDQASLKSTLVVQQLVQLLTDVQ